MDPRDSVLQQSCPMVGMPIFSSLAPLGQNGERLIMGRNGTFLEVRRAWARIVTQVGPALATTVPFGTVEEKVEYTAPKLPRWLLGKFVEWAQEQSSVEIGAVITWNEHTGEYLLRRSKSNHATAASLDYELPELAEGEHVVVDCHSHSHHGAFFSPTDDADDAHAVRFAFVVGHCDTSQPSTASRLCVRGVFKPYNWKI